MSRSLSIAPCQCTGWTTPRHARDPEGPADRMQDADSAQSSSRSLANTAPFTLVHLCANPAFHISALAAKLTTAAPRGPPSNAQENCCAPDRWALFIHRARQDSCSHLHTRLTKSSPRHVVIIFRCAARKSTRPSCRAKYPRRQRVCKNGFAQSASLTYIGQSRPRREIKQRRRQQR